MLIAGLSDEHRTRIELRNGMVKGITAGQIHLAYADLVTAPPGSNFTFSGKSV